METLTDENIQEILNNENIAQQATDMMLNMSAEELSELKKRACFESETKKTKEAINKLKKGGLNRKKMVREMKEAKKLLPKVEKGETIKAIFLNESRKLREIELEKDNMEKSIKKIVKFENLDESKCSQLCLTKLEGKNIHVFTDSSKLCEKGGNKRLVRITGINNHGSAIFVSIGEDLTISDFENAEKELLSGM